MKRLAPAALAATVLLAASACSGQPAASSSGSAGSGGKTATVVTTTTMLGSVVGDITKCAGGTTTSLMSPGTDPHDFAPSSKQVTELVKADLVVANGLGLEGGLHDVLANAAKDGAKVYEVGEDIDPIPFGEHEADEHEGHDHGSESAAPSASATASASAHDEHEGHDHGSEDPHFWLDPDRMAKAATLVGDKLAASTGNDKYRSCAAEVATNIKGLGDEMTKTMSSIPHDKRVLITDHDAFGYFAQKFDFEVVGVVVPGGSTQAEPSSADVAALVDTIKDHQVHAIFSNTATNPKLVEQVAKEVGADVHVVPLYVGSVGKDDASTYTGMMRANAKAIADALKG